MRQSRGPGRAHEPHEPDPTSDTWSAWLPRLDDPKVEEPTPVAPVARVAPRPPVSPAPRRPDPSWHAAPPPAVATPMAPPLPTGLYAPPPPNRMALAILCTIFCFMPFGIVAVVKASTVNVRWSRGQAAAALRASRSVKKWCLLAALVWPGSGILLACTVFGVFGRG